MAKAVATHSLFVRSGCYLVHQLDLVERLAGGIDAWLSEHLNIHAVDIRQCLRHVYMEVYDRVNGCIADILRAVRDGKASTAPLYPPLATIIEKDVFRISAPTAGVRRVLDLLCAEPGSLAMPQSLLPVGGRPTSRDYPVLAIEDRWYCFNPQAVADELPRLLGKWIGDRDKAFFDKVFTKHRERITAEIAVEALCGVLPGATSGKSLYYGNDDAERCETDGIILYDDVLIVVEAKAGALSLAARQGWGERLRRDFGSLVAKAASQAQRAADFVRGNPNGVFTDDRGRPVLELKGRSIRSVYLINPVLDSMDPLAVGMADARSAGLLPDASGWPWTVSVNDLRLVTDILDTPSIFLLYLDRRLRFNDHSSWFRIQDEVDALDYFMRQGLFLEDRPYKNADFVQWQADTADLDRHYAARALEMPLPPKPKPPFDADVVRWVGEIEKSGVTSRTALAIEILSFRQARQHEIANMLSTLAGRLALRGRPQSGVIVRKGFGMSLWVADQYDPDAVDHLLREDSLIKYDRRTDEWISAFFALEGTTLKLVQVVRNAEPWREEQATKELVQQWRDAKYEMRRSSVPPGRNDLCPCGSGRKFKRCHGP